MNSHVRNECDNHTGGEKKKAQNKNDRKKNEKTLTSFFEKMREARLWWRARSTRERMTLLLGTALLLFVLNLTVLHRAQLGPDKTAATGVQGGESEEEEEKDDAKSCPAPRDGPTVRPLVPLRAQAKIALLVLCYNRPKYLQKTMEGVLALAPRDNFPVILSQDGDEPGMADFIRTNYVNKGLAVHVQRKKRKKHTGQFKSYHHIADHYRFALGQVFDVLKFDTAVVLEDDMLIAPDFFDYFAALAPMLHADETLLCVSAWNDNGMKDVVDPKTAATQLRRTSVFPGLGWMLTRAVWEQELREKWPKGFWDDWLREPAQSRGRDCIFPTVSRTKTIGEIGSSAGQFFSKYLARIVLNSEKVDWEREPLSYLQRDGYARALRWQVAAARVVGVADLKKEFRETTSDVKVFFSTAKQYKKIADTLHLMNDLKSGIPRSSFEGIVSVETPKKAVLFVVPQVKEETKKVEVAGDSEGKKEEEKEPSNGGDEEETTITTTTKSKRRTRSTRKSKTKTTSSSPATTTTTTTSATTSTTRTFLRRTPKKKSSTTTATTTKAPFEEEEEEEVEEEANVMPQLKREI